MSYSVKPEIKYKPKEVEEKFRVWEAGGHILAITNKADAERIVTALNHDKLFDEMARYIRVYACYSRRGKALLAKIDKGAS